MNVLEIGVRKNRDTFVATPRIWRSIEEMPVERRPERSKLPMIAYAFDYPARHVVKRHHHGRGQLVYASTGVMRVITSAGIWVTPPLRAIWVPAFVDHEIVATTPVALRTLYIRPDLSTKLPPDCVAIEVSPLLRELILRLVSVDSDSEPEDYVHDMVKLTLHEFRVCEQLPLRLPIPRDKRLTRVCSLILEDLEHKWIGTELAEEARMSVRSMSRHFERECGMGFAAWLTQARLIEALVRLTRGESVTKVALELGYDSPSAFTSMFRRHLGKTPTTYISAKEV